MGICPDKFGPYFWGALHLACLYGGDLEALKAFINSYTEVLPCPMCRVHFAEVISLHPIPSEGDPMIYFKWSVDVHNIVNKKLDKPFVTVQEALAKWGTCDSDQKFDWEFTFGIILMVILVVALFKKF